MHASSIPKTQPQPQSSASLFPFPHPHPKPYKSSNIKTDAKSSRSIDLSLPQLKRQDPTIKTILDLILTTTV